MPLKIPKNIELAVQAHKKWTMLIKEAQRVIGDDDKLQARAAKGFRIKERALPPEVLGRTYAQYCSLINRMYEVYLNSVQLQRAPYIKGIIEVILRRLFELRNELVNLIINDYIYVDASLIQMRLTPIDIEIVVPCHYAIEARPDSIEELLQNMWAEAVMRKNAPPPKIEVKKSQNDFMMDDDEEDLGLTRMPPEESPRSSVQLTPEESVSTIIPEEYIQATIIQTHERFRQFYVRDVRAKNQRRRAYFAKKAKYVPKSIQIKAATLVQLVYRQFMVIMRQRVKEHKLNVLLGIVPDPWAPRLDYEEEDRKLYLKRRRVNERARQIYMQEFEKEKTRLIVFKRDNQIEDISEQIRYWFREWYDGYGFFPQYPYDTEGGTIMVMRGDYPTVEEKIEQDEKEKASKKVKKTKEMIKAEKAQAKLDAELKAEMEKKDKKRQEELEFKMKCNPFADLGYLVQISHHMDRLTEVFLNYSGSWSIYDKFPPETCAEAIYGFMKPLMTEEIMCEMHQECRVLVDELMRLELKLLITAHKAMYKLMEKQFPKIKPRKKPPPPPPVPVPKPLDLNDDMMKKLEKLFNIGFVSKPTRKIKDIVGDSNYAAYELNVRDPDSRYPPPGYGDIRRRLTLSCVFGSGIEPSAPRKKAVLLLGPPRNGKSFLVDCVVGEMNAVKLDISPEAFSAVIDKPKKRLSQVFVAARLFQPSVIFLKNIERVFMTKAPPEQKSLKAKVIKRALVKCVNAISAEDKIIFIATCSNPFGFRSRPMVSLFKEMILVPRTDYPSVQMFFYNKLQSIRSVDRDYCVQPIAQLLQGYGFGVLFEVFDKVLNPERIVRLNVTPLCPSEFLEELIISGAEPVTLEDYKEYTEFFIRNSSLRKPREDLVLINRSRAAAYTKMAKKLAEEEKKKEKA